MALTVEFLDNLIEVSGFPTPDYERMAKTTRPLGLGIMGLADALVLMGLPYDSRSAILFAEALAKRMTRAAIVESARLAQEKAPFELYEENKEDVLAVVERFFEDDPEKEMWMDYIKVTIHTP